MFNNLKLILLLSTFFVCACSNLFAQYGYYNDISRFSHSFSGGSARIQGLGDAQTSLGGDISSISGNPAGLGFFNKSVLSFGYELKSTNSNSKFLDGNTNDLLSSNELNNIAFVLKLGKKNSMFMCDDCPRINIGFSYTKNKDFGSNIRYSGYNNDNSILDYFLEESQGVSLSQISSSLPIQGIGLLQEAYDHYLLNPISDLPNSYYSFVGGYPFQEEIIENRGSISQFSLSSGINVKDKLYLGAGLNLYSIRYDRSRTYNENNFEILVENQWVFEGILDYLTLNDFLAIQGNGFSTTLGIIFKPIHNLNFGISYESKKSMKLNEESYNQLETNYFDYYFESEDTILQNAISSTAKTVAEYKIFSPAKLSIGSSFFYKKFGFITADVDLINYSSAKVSSYDFDPFYDNREIIEVYKSLAINYRIGLEGRYNNFYLRFGYNFLTNAYNKATEQTFDNDNSRIKKSVGIGYSNKIISIDLTYLVSKYSSKISPYTFKGQEPIANSDIDNSTILISLGFKFNN